MKQFGLLWLGLLLAPVELKVVSRPRRLCGRHLLSEITKLCGDTNWSQFVVQQETPLLSQTSRKVEAFNSDPVKSQIPSPAWERLTNPAFAFDPKEKAINGLETQSLPNYQYEKANMLPDTTREFLSPDLHPHVESVKLQKKNTNKINNLSSLFWGNHPQRRRRGYSDKCCIKGCTKEELVIACLPYIDFLKLNDKMYITVTEMYRPS